MHRVTDPCGATVEVRSAQTTALSGLWEITIIEAVHLDHKVQLSGQNEQSQVRVEWDFP